MLTKKLEAPSSPSSDDESAKFSAVSELLFYGQPSGLRLARLVALVIIVPTIIPRLDCVSGQERRTSCHLTPL